MQKFYPDIRRYVLLIATAVLVLLAFYFQTAKDDMYRMLLQEKFASIRYDADFACSTFDYLVQRDNKWDVQKYQDTLIFLASKIDATSKCYGELFDEQFNSISKRSPVFPNKTFDPKEYPDLMFLMQSENTGDYTVMFDPQVVPAHELHLHWRWIPTDKEIENRLLLIVGCTKYSVNTKITDKFINSTVALFLISSVFVIGSIMMLSVRSRRTGDNRAG
ncbi:MAG: hypothetical protein FWE67_07300 [Planctomycetaceae bacterium]|nr:hypothetical protein [Planctomycetaceae bacterium]